jgi:hypothetical protein
VKGDDRALAARVDHAKVLASLENPWAYSPDPFRQKCSALFEHYESI